MLGLFNLLALLCSPDFCVERDLVVDNCLLAEKEKSRTLKSSGEI